MRLLRSCCASGRVPTDRVIRASCAQKGKGGTVAAIRRQNESAENGTSQPGLGAPLDLIKESLKRESLRPYLRGKAQKGERALSPCVKVDCGKAQVSGTDKLIAGMRRLRGSVSCSRLGERDFLQLDTAVCDCA
jgi:hypothetical protein